MLQHKYCKLPEVTIHYVEAGAAHHAEHPLLVFLHGFPEYWHAWHHQLDYFAGQYRCIAPDLPGYNLSSKPASEAFFQVPNLIAVMADFIRRVAGKQPVVLVAHDWGGAIAWPLAAFHPHLIRQLVIANAAHPSTFTREMINNPLQRQKSAYIHRLIAEDGEQQVTTDNYAMLREIAFAGRQGMPLNEQEQQGYLDSWRQPGAVSSMLAYYRQMPQLAASEQPEGDADGPVKALDAIKIPHIRIACPTLVLWGEQDEAFVPELLDGLEAYVPDCRIQRFSEASHWLQHECPDAVNAAIDGFVSETK